MAQISIPETVILDLYDTEVTIHEATDPSAVADLVPLEGPDQTWDFTGSTYVDTLEFVQTFIPFPASVPGASSEYFSDATHIIQFSADTAMIYNYQRLDDGRLYSLGLATVFDVDEDGAVDTLISRSEPPSLSIVFPLTYESTWTDSSALIISFDIPGFPEEFSTGTSIDTTVVDGWGTLITPDGTFPALRMKQTSTTTSESPIPGIPVTTFTSTELTFVTANGPAAGISLDENGDPTSASYTTLGGSGEPIPVEQDAVPDAFVLDQNYPNPFNPATLISYTLNEPGHVRLTVFDVQGRPVSTLVDGAQPVGRHGAIFDARTLPSGSYVYRLETPAGVQSRTMTLVR